MKNTTVLLLGALTLCACGEQARLERALNKYDEPGKIPVPIEEVSKGLEESTKGWHVTAGYVLAKSRTERIDELGMLLVRARRGDESEQLMEEGIILQMRNVEASSLVDCELYTKTLLREGTAAERHAYMTGEHPLNVVEVGDLVVVKFNESRVVDEKALIPDCELLDVVNKSVSLPESDE